MKWLETGIIFGVTGIITILGDVVGYHFPLREALLGYVILLAITLIGMGLTKLIPVKLPMVFWISLVAIISTTSFSPLAATITAYTNKVDFLALCTPILAYAGLSVGKDLAMFKKMSWRIIVVALAVYTGTFVFATMIAQLMLHVEGII